MTEPKEPACPPGTRTHRKRVAEIDKILPEGKIGGICIDNTDEHKAFYLHELKKYPRLTIDFQGVLSDGIYLIRVVKGPSLN